MEGYFGILSVLPPVVAVLVAWKFKNVLVALFLGAYVGALILTGWNPFAALVMLVKDFILVQAADSYNSNLLVMMVFVGGFVGVVTYSGGAKAFAELAANKIGGRTGAQIGTWLAGILIFFSDSCSPLLVGSIFRPICDRMKVSREKLAWMLDTTASPVCILIPFIGWGIYIQGLIRNEFDALGNHASEWTTFIEVIPYQFYALGALLLVPLVAVMGFEFSAMHRAEKRTVDTGMPYWPEAKVMGSVDADDITHGKARFIVVPLILMFTVFLAILIPTGFPVKPAPGALLRTALCSGYFVASIACIALMVHAKVKTTSEAYEMYMRGVKEIVFILLILVLAWSIGSVCKKVGTAQYIVMMAQGNVPGWIVPALLFVTGAIISFSTGSSWGAFAILIPLAIPMAYGLEAPLLPCIGAVLSGGLFGDHCSPISDTTILSSMGAGCDHLDHVKTQLPYALTVAAASLVGYIVAGFFPTPAVLAVSLAAVFILTVVFSKLWGQRIR
ncbi:Na+/H+ antiporter NhaC family protein [Cloacibacillus sp. An23]|uniref:Na+/H+ antiporter NhaC family protein n=1 Tax=Cloacibacillus sp. An23 TaxID=1965591 RepID=UPI000B376DA7|nr:Na+/H+ antiporter NhaC family protein [Cloacibacillus sp. An23]OUO93960.1 sodium:proton exchanger [Cloacibacillus sp. An23]